MCIRDRYVTFDNNGINPNMDLIASTMGAGARKSFQKYHNFRLKPYEASHFLPMEKGDQLSSDIESFILR